MKKLIMFMLIGTLATLGVACSSDDNSSDNGSEQLVIKSSSLELAEGEKAFFTVTAGKKEIKEVKFFIENTEIKNPHVFVKEGNYTVIAKKQGYLDSAALIIKVTKVQKQDLLVLSTDKKRYQLGDIVSFTTKVNGKDIENVLIKDGQGNVVKDNKWKAEKAGTFNFTASKEGYKTSVEVAVIVEEPIGSNYIELDKRYYRIDESKTVLVAETIVKEGKRTIRIYEEKEGDEGGEGKNKKYYSRFIIDVRTSDFSFDGEKATGCVARIWKKVYQDGPNTPIILPGVNPEREVNLDGYILGEEGQLDFGKEHINYFDVKIKDFNDRKGSAKAKIVAPQGSFVYEGNLDSGWYIDTDGKNTMSSSKQLKNLSFDSFTK